MNRALALLLACTALTALAALSACEPKPQGPKATAAPLTSPVAFRVATA